MAWLHKDLPDLLRYCLEEFPQTAQNRHHRVPDFASIETAGASLHDVYPLTFELLHRLFQACRDANWWFEDYWDPPGRQGALAVSFAIQDFDDETERQGIQELLAELKHIELVSIVLRFARPDRYGILSPPVQRVLHIAWGSNAVETYLNYLANLREIQRAAGFRTAAEADMALWVLHAKRFGGEPCPPRLREFYDMNPFLLRLRARNLLTPLARLPKSVFAKALYEVRSDIAAIVVCHTFESLVRKFAEQRGVHANELREVIDALRRLLPSSECNRWHALRKIRNELFHNNIYPTDSQINEFIQVIEWIEAENERSTSV
ncbi:MAG: hypothetical protein D6690_02720 [Nitrospirae bacterium]|nr:MAG: hypothetical protein D6690_02720 [Nitrospirota bacterium]